MIIYLEIDSQIRILSGLEWRSETEYRNQKRDKCIFYIGINSISGYVPVHG